jgi:hypothetical protein
MSQATHDDNISIQIDVAAPPISRRGFGTPAIMAVDAFDSKDGPANDGNRRPVRTFANASEVVDAVAASDGLRKDWLEDMASQIDKLPNAAFPIKIINVDFDDFGGADGGGVDYDNAAPADLYKNALQKAVNYDGDFYGICFDITETTTSTSYVNQDTGSGGTEEPTGADFIYEAATSAAVGRRLVFIQDANSAWLTDSDPIVNTKIVDNGGGIGIKAEGGEPAGRSFAVYHDNSFDGGSTTNFPKISGDSRAYQNIGYASQLLSFTLDEQSPPADLDTSGLRGLQADIDSSQRDAVKDNAGNLGLPYPPSTNYTDPGQALDSRPMYEFQSVDWLYFRMLEDVRRKKVQYSRRGEKFPVSTAGERIFASLVGKRLNQGETADHFLPGSTAVLSTGSDPGNESLSATLTGQFLVSARKFDINVTLTRS